MKFNDRISHILSLDEQATAIDFEGEGFSWGTLSSVAGEIGDVLDKLAVGQGAVVGWDATNHPTAIAALVALIVSERCAAAINPHAAAATLADDIRTQRFPAIVGGSAFWQTPGVVQAACEVGSAGIEIRWNGNQHSIELVAGLETVGAGPHRAPMPGAVIERLSSGTTGPPKRTPYWHDALVKALTAGEHKQSGGSGTEDVRLKTSAAILFRPFAHGGGSFAVLLALYQARPISLHKKFSVDGWVDAVRKHRPKISSLVPTMIKMVMDADVPAEALSSLIAIRSGTAPLDPVLQERFEARYNVPILIDYGATEYGGAAGWSLPDHRQYASQKRGSVGRAQAGVGLRVVDAKTRLQVPNGSDGLLEVQSPRIGPDWISTNDIACIDDDGFLFIRGRADDAIIRGGFKVLPDEVAAVLRQHDGVRDAAVVGIKDDTLGEVPVAVIEIYPDRVVPDDASLREFARARLTPYQVPAAFKFIDSLPRNAASKVVRSELLAIAMR